MKLEKEETWSLKEISNAYGVSVETLRKRCIRHKLYPINYNGTYVYRLIQNQIDMVTNFAIRKEDRLPEIIYVHTTWEIRESKLNFM